METKSVICINPPPHDKCCERCRKHISEFIPFGGKGDPLVGDFNGQLLVKTFRGGCEPYKKYDDIIENVELSINDSYENWKEFEEELEKQQGKEKAEDIINYMQMNSLVSASWECRDCIVK